MKGFIFSATLLLTLINPFLVIIYLTDVVRKLEPATFRRVLLRAGMISSLVFCTFALLGDAVFSDLMHAEFASFQIFGGVVFLLIGIQFVFQGHSAIQVLRGTSGHIAGAIAMPVLIGPGTISASVLIGQRLEPLQACLAVLTAVTISLLTIVVLKSLHDLVLPKREILVDRYIEVAGRITALFVGTIAVEMIMRGLLSWAEKFRGV